MSLLLSRDSGLRPGSPSDKLQVFRTAAAMNILEKVFLMIRLAIRSRRAKAQTNYFENHWSNRAGRDSDRSSRYRVPAK